MPSCFVMMPFGDHFDGYYADVIRPVLAAAGVNSIRADEIYSTGAIIDDIFSAISTADICLADVTDRNPNVSYELGMAHALGKLVILITQHIEDVPFDYCHLRMVVYEPRRFGWDKDFRRTVESTMRSVFANPSAHRPLKVLTPDAEPPDLDAMRNHLRKLFEVEAYDLDRMNTVYIDTHGHAEIQTSWSGTTRSPLYHLCHNIVCDNPGPIEVRKVYDPLNARDLEWVVVDKGPAYLSYFFLFKQFKGPDQPFETETAVYAPGYLDITKFLAKGTTVMTTQAVEGGIRYIRKVDRVYFPREPMFSTVTAEYISHPRKELIGSRVAAIDTGSHYLLEMVYDASGSYQQETGARFHTA